MKELNVFDLDNDKMFSRKALRKILRQNEDNLEQRNIWQLIETFGFPKPIYRYADNEVYDDNENTYSKAVEHFSVSFIRNVQRKPRKAMFNTDCFHAVQTSVQRCLFAKMVLYKKASVFGLTFFLCLMILIGR